jgi:hypothetical protein
MKMAPKNWRLAARPSGSRPGGDVATTGLGLVFAVWCGKLHQGQTHQHSLCPIIFILQEMSK